jgi:activator of HSP90 ATPase
MSKPLELTATFPTDPLDVYDAWLSGERHAAMTGAAATSEPHVGGEFTAWDGYITGRHVELEPATRIVQAWRTGDFPADAPDSLVEVLFAETPQGTTVTLVHRDTPDGQSAQYEAGWLEFYFEPMQQYFGVTTGSSSSAKKPSAKKPSAKKPSAKKPSAKKPSAKKPGRRRRSRP